MLGKRIRGKSMYVTDVSRQQFSRFASRGLAGRTTLTGQGLVLAPKPCWRNWTASPSRRGRTGADLDVLSVAYGEEVPHAVLGSGTVSNRGRLTRL